MDLDEKLSNLEQRITFLSTLLRDLKWMDYNWSNVSDICSHFDTNLISHLFEVLNQLTPTQLLNLLVLFVHMQFNDEESYNSIVTCVLQTLKQNGSPYDILIPHLFRIFAEKQILKVRVYENIFPGTVRYIRGNCLFIFLSK